MATKALVSVEEYLRMNFDPDREYVDGEIVERHLGENPHSRAQVRLVILLNNLSAKAPVHIRTELRVRLTPTRFRIPDVVAFAGEEPTENVPSSPPLVTIEIISREDRYTEVIRKLDEYREWGVKHVWLVDPWIRKTYVSSAAGLAEVAAFELPEFDAQIPAAEIFA